MKLVAKGKTIRAVKAHGQDVSLIVQRGQVVFAAGVTWPNALDQLIPKHQRIVEDGGKRWFEFGFDVPDAIPFAGDSAAGWSIGDGYGFAVLEWRRDTTQWVRGKFIPAPVATEALLADGREGYCDGTRYWSRAIHPLSAPTATAPELVCESKTGWEIADSRNGPFTGISIDGVAVTLPNAPYAMPADAAALQADLRTAGYTGAIVDATSDVDWKITLLDVAFGADQSARVEFEEYLHHVDEETGYGIYRSWLDFSGARLDADGVEIAPEAGVRLHLQQGARSGKPALLPADYGNPQYHLFAPSPYKGFRTGLGDYNPSTAKAYPVYPIPKITGGIAPGATLTGPLVEWIDPSDTTVSTVITWWKNGVPTSAHGATYADTAEGDIISFRVVATNANGDSVVNDAAWPKVYISQNLIDAGLDDPDWIAPYVDATVGGFATMNRFVDDMGPDWTWAQKNAYHQARGPGMPDKYVLNPELWLIAFADSLSGVSVAQDYYNPEGPIPDRNWASKRGCALVTPQHVVSCGHGAPGMGITGFPSRIRFRGTDGETYERQIVGQKFCYQTSKVSVGGVLHSGDSWIGVLDSPLPAAVHPFRCIPEILSTVQLCNGFYDSLHISQSTENESASYPTQPRRQLDYYPYSAPDYTPEKYHPNYPWHHRTMCCAPGDKYPKVQYFVWAGDSGMPDFIGAGTELLWSGFVGGGGIGPSGYPQVQEGVTITWESLANAMIAAADADAISRGALAAPTGNTVTIFEL